MIKIILYVIFGIIALYIGLSINDSIPVIIGCTLLNIGVILLIDERRQK